LSTIEQQTIKQSIKKSLNEWSKYRNFIAESGAVELYEIIYNDIEVYT